MPAIAVGRYSDGGYSCGQYSHLVIPNLRYQGLSVAHLPRVRHDITISHLTYAIHVSHDLLAS